MCVSMESHYIRSFNAFPFPREVIRLHVIDRLKLFRLPEQIFTWNSGIELGTNSYFKCAGHLDIIGHIVVFS